MTKKIFIVNPASGNGEGKNYGLKLESMLPKMGIDFEIIYTEGPKHATEIASRYFKSDDVDLIAVGGDGTMNEVLNGIHSGVSMGILPCGSGNDFYRLIDPKLISFQSEVEALLNGEKTTIDYGVMNGFKFLGSFSIGMDANVVDRVVKIQEKNKGVRKSAYLRAVAGELFSKHGFNAYLETDDQQYEKKVLMVSALNGRYYGGGFKPAPFADIQDGLFDVSMIDNIPMLTIARLMPKYMAGKHMDLEQVTFVRTNHFTLRSEEEMICQCDGELIRGKLFDLHLVTRGLSFIMPKGTKYEYRK